MDTLVEQLIEKVGLSREKAEQVAEFLAQHASELPKWLGQSGGLADKLPGGLGKHL